MTAIHEFDVLIIGSGAAGLTMALNLSGKARVAILSKGPLEEGSTQYAQGGIAAVMDEKDSTDDHLADTLMAGAGICDEAAARLVIDNAKTAVQTLIDLGVPFDTVRESPDGRVLHLTREGGHSHRRVVHAADATGRAVETTLVDAVRAKGDITVLENHLAIDLIRSRNDGRRREACAGAYVLDILEEKVKTIGARVVVLATGGAAKVYRYTSNPDGATGDGIAMAWRAGCPVANMEFMQFHPTCLHHPEAKSFLITEAIRGEGGKLLLPDGTRFMDGFHEKAELAPRDIVARAIDHEIKRLGCDRVYLDIAHKGRAFIEKHFPTVYNKCGEFGIDIAVDPIPVVPAAHYTCGGVMTDFRGGTNLEGLYAVGEVAYTGLHGANRMASNSLLECLVMGARAAGHIVEVLPSLPRPAALKTWDESWVQDSDEEIVVAHNWGELRHVMWDYVGIVRTTKRLQRARRRVDTLMIEIQEYYGRFRVTAGLLELRNLVTVADLIIRSARRRQESRGLHYVADFPDTDDRYLGPTVLKPGRSPNEGF